MERCENPITFVDFKCVDIHSVYKTHTHTHIHTHTDGHFVQNGDGCRRFADPLPFHSAPSSNAPEREVIEYYTGNNGYLINYGLLHISRSVTV